MTIRVDTQYTPPSARLLVEGEGLRLVQPLRDGEAVLDVSPEAEGGSLRVATTHGVTAARPFVVSDRPELIEREPNETLGQAQLLALPGVVNGRLDVKLDTDTYRVPLRAGQWLVAAVTAKRLGSPGDLVLRLADAAGRTLASNDDHNGTDPLIAFRCPRDGEYLLQLYEVDGAGGPEYVYRLTVTTGPYVDRVEPAVVTRGAANRITCSGWNLGGGGPTSATAVVMPREDAGDRVTIRVPAAPDPITLQVIDAPVALEAAENASEPQALSIPGAVCGRFRRREETDRYRVAVRKGRPLALEVRARSLGSPAEVSLRITDAAGKEVARADASQSHPDPLVYWTPQDDGFCTISLADAAGATRGGEEFHYVLLARPPHPVLQFTTGVDTVAVLPGGKVEIPIHVLRGEGVTGEIAISAGGLPVGVTASEARIAAAPDLSASTATAEVKLVLNVAAGARSGAYRVQLAARAASQDAVLRQEHPIWLTLDVPAPFSLSVSADVQEVNRGWSYATPVKVMRRDGFGAAVRLEMTDAAAAGNSRYPTVIGSGGLIPAGKAEGALHATLQATAQEGTHHRFKVMGIAELMTPEGPLEVVVLSGTVTFRAGPPLLSLRVPQEHVTLRGASR